MKVEVLYGKKSYGTIETTKRGLAVTGDTATLKRLIEDLQDDQSDESFVSSLPARLHGQVWAREVG